MLLAQISDTHFRSRGQKLYGFIDVNAANADVVSQLNALAERPDAVVVSGDIVNCGRPQEYEVARQILGSLNYPLYLIPGNHDDKALFLEYLHPLCPQLGSDPQNMHYAVDDFATRLLFIDSSRAGTSSGWLTDETIKWLEAQLFDGGDKPATVFMHHPPLPLGNAQQSSGLGELLAQSDIVTLHVPELASTNGMMGAAQIAAMKPGSILINASRGTVVDIEALAESLKSGKLLGAAIDVFPKEPKSNKDEFLSPLRGMDNVILTPHIGGSTMEAQANIGLEVAEKLVKYSDNGTTTSAVNFPEVALPEHPGNNRILHVHENRPGILSAINQVFADNGINIAGQYLRTDEKVGYVVIDIDAKSSALALEKLAQIAGTIRCRVLF